ncbi:MAG: hypothetical protein R2697_07735 [Ilumatobacteraceae bacterium]
MALVTGQPPAPSYFVYGAILNRKDRELLDESAMRPPSRTTRSSPHSPAAHAGRRPDARKSSRRATSARRSTSASRVATPVRRFGDPIRPPTSCSSSSPASNWRANRLARIGFDRVIGYLDQPYEVLFRRRDDVQIASRLTAKAFDERRRTIDDLQIVDVRNPERARRQQIDSAVRSRSVSCPAARRRTRRDPRPTVVCCARDCRSSVAAKSLLRQKGVRRRQRHHRLRRLGRAVQSA